MKSRKINLNLKSLFDKGSIQPTLMYAGYQLHYNYTTDDIDEAQEILDYYRTKGKQAACTHQSIGNGVDIHHVYVERRDGEFKQWLGL